MPINAFQIYMCIPCNKSIVCFIHKLYYILKKIVVLCIALPHRRGSCPNGARLLIGPVSILYILHIYIYIYIYIYLYHDEATLQSFRLGYISATVIY